MRRHIKRPILLTIGSLCLALAAIGAFLPLLPTTPFVLLALWAFSKSARRFHDYIWNHPRLGATARDWELHRVVPRRAKVSATLVMLTSALLMVFVFEVPTAIAITAILTMAIVLAWLLSRPERVPGSKDG